MNLSHLTIARPSYHPKLLEWWEKEQHFQKRLTTHWEQLSPHDFRLEGTSMQSDARRQRSCNVAVSSARVGGRGLATLIEIDWAKPMSRPPEGWIPHAL